MAYGIDELGIPNMLIDDARAVSDDEHRALMTKNGQ
ncbi:hypothetical protein SAMN04488550_4561 [Gordonia malaquae]|nr:hypothetical protein SAMN04488550_4561 [Gordonia malaquae]